MLKIGVADYGMFVWEGGLFDYEQRLRDIKAIGYDGLERLRPVSAVGRHKYRRYGQEAGHGLCNLPCAHGGKVDTVDCRTG